VARLAQLEFDERYARLARRASIDFFATHSAAVRRWVFLQAGGFRGELRGNEDVELAFALSHRGYELAFAPRAAVYHEHPATLLSYLRTKASRGFWRTVAYAAHPDKVMADAYTPFRLKLQVALMALGFVLLPLVRVHPAFLVLFVLSTVTWLAAGWPFAWFVARREPRLVFAALGFAVLRSYALAAGVLAGVVALALGRYKERGAVARH
jgi:GT2 family glycosyltransferase